MPDFDGDFGARAIRSTASPALAEQMGRLNKSRMTPLNKFQREVSQKAKPIYIYNVSPIHEWKKNQGQLGTIVIPKKAKGERVSKPAIIPGVVNRFYDKGLGRKEVFQESGMEVAQDICGCSAEYPVEAANNNLTNFGVFITTAPFDELPKKQQDELLEEADNKLREKLRNLILEADNLYRTHPTWIGGIHVDALNALNELERTKEERPWAPVRYSAKTEDCRFCGSPNKPGVPVCANCHNVLDEEKYAKLGGKKAS